MENGSFLRFLHCFGKFGIEWKRKRKQNKKLKRQSIPVTTDKVTENKLSDGENTITNLTLLTKRPYLFNLWNQIKKIWIIFPSSEEKKAQE